MTKVIDIANSIEKFAPKFLKESYDNVGLMVGDRNQEVKKILLALDCKLDTIEEAKSNNVDLIITHHPLLFRKPSRIIKGDLQGDKIINLIKNNISLYSCHTNLDSAKNGINETIVNLLGFKNSIIIEKSKVKGFEDAGIGRMVSLDRELSPLDVISLVKEKLNISSVKAAIGKRKIKKIAIINGSGQDFFEESRKLGADCIITGDTTYHFVSDYNEMGMTIIDAGHFNTENIIFYRVMETVLSQFNDIDIKKSSKSKDVYEFL